MATSTVHIQTRSLKVQLVRGVEAFTVRFAPTHVHTNTSGWRFLATNTDPVHEIIRRSIENRDGSFWWNCYATGNLCGKAVVRSWARNRCRVAFRNALEKHGLDRDGRRLTARVGAASDGSRAASRIIDGDLVGTAQIRVEEPALRMKFVELQKQADQVIEHLLQLQKKVPQAQVDAGATASPSLNLGKRGRSLRPKMHSHRSKHNVGETA